MQAADNSAPILLVTGGSGSIGRVVAARATAQGWTVLVHGRSDRTASRVAADLSAAHTQGTFRPCSADFTDRAAIVALIDGIKRDHGRLDAVIHCAVSAPSGITGMFRDTDPDAYTSLCHHAVTGLQWLCHASFPLLAQNGGGAMVAVSSDAGLFAAPGQSLIATTRAAAMAFCRNVALEVARDGIRVNCVSTSFVEDSAIFRAMIDAGSTRVETARKRAGLGLPKPDAIADLALFLVGTASRHITGQVVSINGGLNA